PPPPPFSYTTLFRSLHTKAGGHTEHDCICPFKVLHSRLLDILCLIIIFLPGRVGFNCFHGSCLGDFAQSYIGPGIIPRFLGPLRHLMIGTRRAVLYNCQIQVCHRISPLVIYSPSIALYPAYRHIYRSLPFFSQDCQPFPLFGYEHAGGSIWSACGREISSISFLHLGLSVTYIILLSILYSSLLRNLH